MPQPAYDKGFEGPIYCDRDAPWFGRRRRDHTMHLEGGRGVSLILSIAVVPQTTGQNGFS